jgi:hypothetical protein
MLQRLLLGCARCWRQHTAPPTLQITHAAAARSSLSAGEQVAAGMMMPLHAVSALPQDAVHHDEPKSPCNCAINTPWVPHGSDRGCG